MSFEIALRLLIEHRFIIIYRKSFLLFLFLLKLKFKLCMDFQVQISHNITIYFVTSDFVTMRKNYIS